MKKSVSVESFNKSQEKKCSQTDEQLKHLFQACDTTGKGYIVVSELQELCQGLGIGKEDAEAIFADLDHDQDKKISYQDFCTGFKEFLNPDFEEQSRRRSFGEQLSNQHDRTHVEEDDDDVPFKNNSNEFLRRKSIYQAWTNLTSNLVDLNLLSIAPECDEHIQNLCKDLEGTAVPKEVAFKVENVFSKLVSQLQQLQEHNANLKDMYKKEKEGHLKTLKSIEVEMEDQMNKVQQCAIDKAKSESAEEKRILQAQMEKEVAEMQAHLTIFQKMDSWVKRENSEDIEKIQSVRQKLDDAHQDNRELSMKLQETNTGMVLLKSELAQSRMQYEEKCQELHSEREQVLEYIHQYDTMKRQLDLLHEANKRLHDTNDSLRETLDFEFRKSPLGSRCSSHRSSVRKRKGISPIPNPLVLPESDSENSLTQNFGIGRLLEDLDSGLSTLPDTAEENSEEKSLEQGPTSLDKELDDVFPKQSPNSYWPSSQPKRNNPFQDNSQYEINFQKPNNFQLSNSGSFSMIQQSSFDITGPPDRTYKVVFAGDAAVGKSTFIVRLCQGVFVKDLASTLGVDYKVKSVRVDEKNMAIQLWDTAGQERFRSITKTYFRKADGILLLYDVTNERSFLNVRQWVEDLNESCPNRIPMVVCGNKSDVRDMIKYGGRTVTTKDGESLATSYGANFYETSCKTGTNVLDAFIDLARKMALTEDVEVQTSALKLVSPEQKSKCCNGSQKNR